MIDAPKQQMLGIFSVFVKWVSDVKQGSSGPCIRVRAVIGKQWSTIQIPLNIAPQLKKGDFIEVKGSVTALSDKDGASNYLFVDEVISHQSAEGIQEASDRQTPQRNTPSPARPAAQQTKQSGQDQAPQSQRRGGYGSNQKIHSGSQTRPPDFQGNQVPAPEQQPQRSEHGARKGGYQSNRRLSSPPSQRATHVNQPSQNLNPQTQHVSAAHYEQQRQPQNGGYRSNQPASSAERPPVQQEAPQQRPLGGYARNRVRSQTY